MKSRLAKITDIRNGYQFREKVVPVELSGGKEETLPPGVLRVIQIKDIDDDRRLHTDDLTPVQIDIDREKYEARQGDVLFLSRGNRLFATAITEPLRDAVATGYFFILRPSTDKLLARYLAWYINQPPFQAALRACTKGTQQPLVARKDIEDLEVEIPPLATQETIVSLDDLRVKESQLVAAIQEKRNQLIQSLSMKAARQPS